MKKTQRQRIAGIAAASIQTVAYDRFETGVVETRPYIALQTFRSSRVLRSLARAASLFSSLRRSSAICRGRRFSVKSRTSRPQLCNSLISTCCTVRHRVLPKPCDEESSRAKDAAYRLTPLAQLSLAAARENSFLAPAAAGRQSEDLLNRYLRVAATSPPTHADPAYGSQ